jgi:hypothetical protein
VFELFELESLVRVGFERGRGPRICACGCGYVVVLVVPVFVGPLCAVVVTVFERVSPLVGHPFELFELVRFVYELTVLVGLVYRISLVSYFFAFVSLDYSVVFSFPVCPSFLVLVPRLHGFVSIAIGLSVSVFESLG